MTAAFVALLVAFACLLVAFAIMQRRHSREVDRLSDALSQAITELVRLRNELASARAAKHLMRDRGY